MSLWVALEVDFLLALALGEENCCHAIDIISGLRGHAVVTPSVLQELADQAANQTDVALRGPAAKALKELATWNILSPPLESKMHGVADVVAKKIVARGLCEDYQSALVLAEAACSECRLLLTYQSRICAIDNARLKLVWLEHDVADCTPFAPHWLVASSKPPVTHLGSSADTPADLPGAIKTV